MKPSASPRAEYLMCAPRFLSNAIPNNPMMADLARHFPQVDRAEALAQFDALHRFVGRYAHIDLLPPVDGLQDQAYVSNLGICVQRQDSRTIVLSKFRSEPRRGEEDIGARFFSARGFLTVMSPSYFEGEADLKRLGPTCYVGAFGLRTSRQALRWFARRFDVEVLECELINPYLYHLDCVLMPLGDELLVATEQVRPETLRELEKRIGVVHVPTNAALAGATSCLELAGHLLCDDNRDLFKHLPELRACEAEKLRFLQTICDDRELTLVPFPMAEFIKSGASMSCLFMKLGES
jgi:N-dimethylarginine dimethylaminohydrolase